MLETMIRVAPVETAEDIKQCYKVMQQFRPHLVDEMAFVKQVQRQIKDGYHLVCMQENGTVKALAGFRFLEFLAWGRVLYVDDLVTCSEARGLGHGNSIVQWLIHLATGRQCDQLHLDSGPQRHDAHRLYMKHKMKIVGHHFSLDLREKY